MITLIEILMGAIIIVAIILFFVTSRGPKIGPLDTEFYKEEWQKLLNQIKIGEAGWRLAIIDADKLLDQALQARGAAGETMGDRLRATEGTFSKYNNLWSAHKCRNRLVHEPGAKLTKQLTQRVVGEYHRALKELGAFDD